MSSRGRALRCVGPGLLVLALLGCEGRPLRVLLVGDSIAEDTVSEPKGPAYADLLAMALGPRLEPAEFAPQDLHPNAAGRATIAGALAETIRRLTTP